jgi:hypothetical protein
LKPEIFTGHALILGVWIAVEASSILLGWLKFRRIANLHLYLTKAAGVVAYAFVIYTFVAGYNEIFFYVTVTLLIVSSLECLILQLFAPRVDEHMKSIYHVPGGGFFESFSRLPRCASRLPERKGKNVFLLSR